MLTRSALGAMGALVLAGWAQAQGAPAATAPAPAPAMSAAAPTAVAVVAAPTDTGPCCHIAAGTPIRLELTDKVTSRDQKRGDKFGLKLAEPLVVGGIVVLPQGVQGVGEVVDAGSSGMGGAPGKLLLAGRYLTWNGQQIPLRGLKIGGAGKDHSQLAMGVGLAVGGVFGLLVHGGNIEVLAGTQADAKIANDLQLPPAPLQAMPATTASGPDASSPALPSANAPAATPAVAAAATASPATASTTVASALPPGATAQPVSAPSVPASPGSASSASPNPSATSP